VVDFEVVCSDPDAWVSESGYLDFAMASETTWTDPGFSCWRRETSTRLFPGSSSFARCSYLTVSYSALVCPSPGSSPGSFWNPSSSSRSPSQRLHVGTSLLKACCSVLPD